MKSTSGDGSTYNPGTKENRCVWMEAGILSYLLCDREFECDHCPLDEAMRSHYTGDARRSPPSVPSAARETGTPAPGPGPAPAGLFTPAHLRVVIPGHGACRIFVEPEIAGLLPPVRSVVLPRSGDRISPDGFCCWLIVEGGTLPVKLPFGATAGDGNPRLADRPHLVNGGDPDDGWLFEFEPDDRTAARKALLCPADAASQYEADRELFRSLVMECLHPEGTVLGRTFQDGGRFIDDLATLIGPVNYLAILKKVFWVHR